MATSIISRTNAAGLIPEEISREIIQGATESSVVLKLGRRLANMTSNQLVLNVLDALPTAYFVNGDTGLKQTTNMAWDKKRIYAEEIAVIVPIPEAVLDDANYDIWGEVRPRIAEAFGKVIDAAVLFGTNKPTSWRAGIVPSATTAGSTVTPSTGAGASIFQDIMGAGGVIAKIEEDGYDPNGVVAGIGMRGKLRGIIDTTGNPIFKEDFQGDTNYALNGMPMYFPKNGAYDATAAQLIAGDWDQLVYSIRQDITFKLFTEGVVQDPANNTIAYNLMQNDMVALRAVMRLGWEIPNPLTAYNAGITTPFPFAVYLPTT